MMSLILERSLSSPTVKTYWKALSSKEFVLQYPPNVYSVMRTINKSSILNYQMHIQRLKDGLTDSHSFAKFREAHKQNLSEISQKIEPAALSLIRSSLVEFHKEHQNDEYKLAIVLYENEDVTDLGMAVQIDKLSSVPFDRGVQVEIHGSPRNEANIKNSTWISEREKFKKVHESTHEVILHSGGDVYEGFTSNIFVIKKDGVVETAPLESVLAGTMQKVVIDVCEENGIKLVYKCPKMEEISQWSSLFITSTSRTLVPADKIVFPHGDSHDLMSSTCDHLNNLRALVLRKLAQESTKIIEFSK